MSVHLKRDLEELHRDLLSMCVMVEEMVHEAVEELSDPDPGKAAELAAKDNEVDAWDIRLEESCLKILALHQPVAIDLRRITSVLKITSELERVADLGVNIAERAEGLLFPPDVFLSDHLQRMAKMSIEMLHQSIDAYVQLDSQLARKVCINDDEVDRMNEEIIQTLKQTMQETPEHVESALHLFSASRHLERVADHATNIAEDVVYLVEGIIIRHHHEIDQEDPSIK